MYTDYPLTKQQLGLWIEQKLHPNNTSYNTCVKVRLTGKLDEQRFLQATQEVIDFFDTLKVYFVEEEGIPFQRIDQNVEYLPELIDISEGQVEETKEKSQQAKQILSDKLNTSIDLTQFPIMRASLIKTAEQVYYFIGMVPHIVSDGRAAILYLESLSVAYNQGKQGLQESYGATKKNWENFQLDGLEQVDEQQHQLSKEHWNNRLKNANHYFDYSYGKQLVDVDDKRGERVYFDLSEDISSKLKAHCKANRTTLFNVFVCAFSIFIHKYYRLNDILIGYPVNIRPPGYKHFFGFFVNILPIRVDMTGDPSYQTLLENIHKIRKEDKKHQKYPALDIVSDIREVLPDFDGRVFNLSMAQTVSRLFDLELQGIDSEPLDSEYYDVNDDFSLSYEMIEQRIGLWFEYRKALFDRDFINQAMQHIETIILQLLEYPGRRISEFDILSKPDKDKILAVSQLSVNNSVTTNSQTIVSLFEKQADQSAKNIAIVYDEISYSYQQLNQQSNQLARKIQTMLGGDVSAVAVSLERGFYLIVTLLAILKAGCFYVPLPISYPKKRKDHILNQAEVKLWMFDKELSLHHNFEEKPESNNKSNTTAIKQINLTTELTELKSFSTENLEYNISAKDKAYIIYTSGSTGKPKGVKLTHDNVVSRLEWLRDYFSFDNSDRILQNTDFSFDVSVAEIFWPLISGATLVIPIQRNNVEPNYLLDLIEQQQITCSCMVPSLLRVLIANDKKQQLKSIKQILAAGEVLPDSLAKLFYSSTSTSHAELYNFYGPTEATIYASFEKVENNRQKSITIGKALANTSLYVLGENHELLPSGVVGELYLGGIGVAEGYQANDSLTAKSFISEPFYNHESSDPNTNVRLYATGDLARFGADGRLEYIGRVDRQVKVRGFRVELGEIETSIAECEGISDVVVINQQIAESQSQLVAYLVKDKNISLSKPELLTETKNTLSSLLPNYMMPSIFVFIKDIPRLASGKLNVHLLPDPQLQFNTAVHYRVAETRLEKSLVKIWSDLLSIHIDKISMNASFFDLGGDSLMAIQFVSLAEKEGFYFGMGDLFEMRNIGQLAGVVKTSKLPIKNQELVSGRYPLLPRQAKFFDDDFVNPNHWNRTFSFSLNHQLDVAAFCSAIETLLKHHDNLRVKFELSDKGIWQQNCVSPEGLTSIRKTIFNQYDLTNLNAADQQLRMTEIINQHHQHIDLTEAPLIRIVHFSTSNEKGQLAIIFHHLLLDMVSSRLIFEDLMIAYQAAKNNFPVELSSKSTSVKQWVLYLQEKARNNDFSKAIDYWQQMPAKPTPVLPNDFSQKNSELLKANCEENAQLKMFTLPKSYTKQLLVDIPNLIGMPIQDFLIASLFELVSDWSNCNEMTVSTCGHGRQVDTKQSESESEQFDLSRTVGWLNTVYPVYLKLPENQPISDMTSINFLNSIKEQLAKVPVDNINYNLLRYSVKHPVMIEHASPELFFNYVGQIDSIIPKGAPFMPSLDLPGLAGIDGRNHLCYQLYFEAGVIGGLLTFRLTYSNKNYKSETIDRLAKQLMDRIENRINEISI